MFFDVIIRNSKVSSSFSHTFVSHAVDRNRLRPHVSRPAWACFVVPSSELWVGVQPLDRLRDGFSGGFRKIGSFGSFLSHQSKSFWPMSFSGKTHRATMAAGNKIVKIGVADGIHLHDEKTFSPVEIISRKSDENNVSFEVCCPVFSNSFPKEFPRADIVLPIFVIGPLANVLLAVYQIGRNVNETICHLLFSTEDSWLMLNDAMALIRK